MNTQLFELEATSPVMYGPEGEGGGETGGGGSGGGGSSGGGGQPQPE